MKGQVWDLPPTDMTLSDKGAIPAGRTCPPAPLRPKPGRNELAIPGEAVHPGVAVSVGDVEVAGLPRNAYQLALQDAQNRLSRLRSTP